MSKTSLQVDLMPLHATNSQKKITPAPRGYESSRSGHGSFGTALTRWLISQSSQISNLQRFERVCRHWKFQFARCQRRISIHYRKRLLLCVPHSENKYTKANGCNRVNLSRCIYATKRNCSKKPENKHSVYTADPPFYITRQGRRIKRRDNSIQ